MPSGGITNEVSVINDRPLTRVEMRGDYDCGVACLAMLTGLPPEQIEDRLGYRPADSILPEICLGVLPEEVVLLLYEHGRQPLHLRSREAMEAEIEEYRPRSDHALVGATFPRRRLLPDHDGILAILADRQAMLALRKANSDYGHFVVWDRGDIIDPHPDRYVERDGLGIWRIQTAIIALA